MIFERESRWRDIPATILAVLHYISWRAENVSRVVNCLESYFRPWLRTIDHNPILYVNMRQQSIQVHLKGLDKDTFRA